MEVAVSKRLYNVDEYHKMAEAGILKPSDRVELINGEIIEMSPIGSKHASVVKKLTNYLIRNFGNEVVIGVQDPVRLDSQNEPEPDISILKYNKDFYNQSHPTPDDILILIEVSDTSYAKDKELKGSLYAEKGIPVFWIINIENNQIEVFSEPVRGQYLKQEIFMLDRKIPIFGTMLDVKFILNL